MGKQLQVLYTIFKLELNPPFELVKTEYSYYTLAVYNKHSDLIGSFDVYDKHISMRTTKEVSILTKIAQVFNAETLSNDDIYHIAKHLVNWLRDKFPDVIESIEFRNQDNGEYIYYPKQR